MADGLNWYAVHVKSRHEFVAADELGKKGLDAFLPSVTRVRQWKDRKKEVRFALFPGYLFVHISPEREKYHEVLKSRGVVAFISLDKGSPTPVPPEEVSSLKSVIESGREIDIYPHLKEGARVRMKKGVLRDSVGVLVRKDDSRLFVVNIDILGRSVGVAVYAEDIEPD